ncbi:MAG: hypothetical protein LBH59_04865 [Planctomycetaceae bacterium]|nr:hypothetical protein [Planctomycetaceae bacterium]
MQEEKETAGNNQKKFAIPKPVWAVGFALEQTLHVVALAVFSYVDFLKNLFRNSHLFIAVRHLSKITLNNIPIM